MSILRSRSVLWAAIICVSLTLIWLIGLIAFANRIPTEITNSNDKTDAIVVLTGGSERIATGIDLLINSVAERLFISGVGSAVNVNTLLSADLPDRNALIAKITLGSEATDTPGNAAETAAWLKTSDLKSIRLVTAAYHMPRSLRGFRNVMPDIVIIPHPVFPVQVKQDWWRYPGTASLLAAEYTKYLFSGLRNWSNSAAEED